MSRSALDRTVAAMLAVAEDTSTPPQQRVKAGDVIRQLLKNRPPRKRRSAMVSKILRESGIAKPVAKGEKIHGSTV